MSAAERRPAMPPVSLPSEAELVRQALSVPGFSPTAGRDGVVGTPDAACATELASAGPGEVLRRWREGLPAVLSAAVAGAATEADAVAELDGLLAALYALTATDASFAAGAMVPLPVLAASLLEPGMVGAELTDEVLEGISDVLPRYDTWLRRLEPYGLVAYRPVDRALLRDAPSATTGAGSSDTADDGARRVDGAAGSVEPHGDDASRYGQVRLTPLGLYGVRARLRAAGTDAPLVGDLADAEAAALLDVLLDHPEHAARAEAEQWLRRRPAQEAARELLAAARGDDPRAPARRLACQQALTLLGQEAGPALREVLDDRHLGGLARVWLVEHGERDVPPPDEEMVFWLTVDTLAAQLEAEGDSPELRELVRGLVDQHAEFFDRAWRVDHPAAGAVLEAMGRAHPDHATAKAARRAAFRARSRAES